LRALGLSVASPSVAGIGPTDAPCGSCDPAGV
jgi:hypothetical protein